ncbi:hypothetical protein DMENIID0001_083440 [Sergentomyia squamirostris]
MASIYVYVKSVLWLIGCSTLGYTLLRVTEPRESKIREIRAGSSSDHLLEDKRKAAVALRKLREAADDKPIYLKTREEIEADNRRNFGFDK